MIILIFLAFTFSSCTKSNLSEEVTGVVNDFTGRLDGCKMLIRLDNGTSLEPYSLPAGFTLIDGRKAKLRYKSLNDKASNCMAGQIVEIVSISYL